MDSQRDYTYAAPTAVEDDEDIDSDAAFDSEGVTQDPKIVRTKTHTLARGERMHIHTQRQTA